MKNLHSPKFLAIAILILAACHMQAQITPHPLPGHLYGQAIVACTGGSTEYVATPGAIYARPASAGDYYRQVWTAPQEMNIVSFAVDHSGSHRAILVKFGSDFYVTYTQIVPGAADVYIRSQQLPPPIAGNYTKIVAGENIYAFSYLAGGPPGNLSVSRDSAQTWALDTAGIGLDAVNDVAIDTAGNVLIAGQGAVYRQLAASNTWTQTAAGGNTAKIFVDHLGRIITSSYGIDTRISLDNGATFTPDNTGISWQVTQITDDAFGNLYATAGSNIYRNTGGTGAWSNITAAFNTATRSANLSCISGDSLLTFGTGMGMYTSIDQGATWTATNAGIFAEQIWSVVKEADGRLLCTTELGVFYKDRADTIWHPTTPITTFYPGTNLSVNPAGEVYVSVSYTFGSPYPLGKSIDEGVNFTVDSDGFSNIGGSGFLLDENGNRHFYNYYSTATDNMTVWTAPFGGSVFSPDTAGMPLFPTFGLGVKDMCGDHRGYLYAAVSLLNGVVMYRRPAAGQTWSVDTMGLGASGIISPMAADASIGLVVARQNNLYRRTANAWVTLNMPVLFSANDYITALSVDANGVIYFAINNTISADSNLIFASLDSGTTWRGAGLPGYTVNQLYSRGDTTYAVTNRGGFFFVSTGVNGIAGTSPQRSIRIYPNPSASGRWTVQTDESDNDCIDISDMNGRMVYTISTHSRTTEINAPDLPSGTYILQVSGAKGRGTAKLVK